VVVGRDGLTLRVDMRETMVPLGEIIVTAARREQRLADAVVETELITTRDLQRGQSDLASILTDRVGIQLDGGVPSGTGVQLRGFGSRRVLVLLDGQPLVGRVNGTMDLARLPVSGIERIEIVKGPQSTLYGTDAIGGVINVIEGSFHRHRHAQRQGRRGARKCPVMRHGETGPCRPPSMPASRA
jgi:outer membrane receptor for ferrienterochelin and colicins